MAGPSRAKAFRVDPGSGQTWRRLQHDDPMTGDPSVSGELIHYGAVPWVWQPMCAAAGVSTAGADYPPTAAEGTFAAVSGNTSVTLASGATTANLGGNPKGLLILVTAGTGIGQYRKIDSVSGSSGSWVATVVDWTLTGSTPTTGSSYILLMDCYNFTTLHIKSEYQNAASVTAPFAKIVPVLYSLGFDNTGTAIKPYRVHGFESTITNQDVTTDATQSGYRHGQLCSYTIGGAIGAKIRLTQAPAAGAGGGGAITFWASVS